VRFQKAEETIKRAREEIESKVKDVFYQRYEYKKLKDIIILEYGISLPKYKRTQGEYPVYGANGIIDFHNTFYIKAPCIIVGRKAVLEK